THPLIGMHHVPVVFGVELGGEFGGIDQVTEQHGELPAFSLWSGVIGPSPCPLYCLSRWEDRRRRGRWPRSAGGGCTRVTSRDQSALRIIAHLGLRVAEVGV